MKRNTRLGIYIVLAIILMLVIGSKFLLQWRFESIINGDIDRAYTITYSDVAIDYTLDGITLKNVVLTPTNSSSQEKTSVHGQVGSGRMEGVSFRKLLFSSILEIDELNFTQPKFNVYLHDDTTRRKDINSGMSGMFGDIISAAAVKNFVLKDGDVIIYSTQPDTTFRGSVQQMNIIADNIRIDSVMSNFLIPFYVENLDTKINGLLYQIDEYRTLDIAGLSFNSQQKDLLIEDASIRFDTTSIAISNTYPFQKDIISFGLKQMLVHGIDMSNIYGVEMRLHANYILIDSLQLHDFRNKKLADPPNIKKPMFKAMLDHVNLPLDVDSILIRETAVSYTEMPANGDKSGTISFNSINGHIGKISTDSLIQSELESFQVQLNAKINNEAPLSFNLIVPYSDDYFYIDAKVSPSNLEILNPTIVPLASIRIDSGRMQSLHYTMDAGLTQSRNSLTLEYTNLNLTVLGKEAGTSNKNGIVSAIANTLVRKNTHSWNRNDQNVTYISQRNIYRGPFNFMWTGVKDGLAQIVPSSSGSLLVKKKNSKKK